MFPRRTYGPKWCTFIPSCKLNFPLLSILTTKCSKSPSCFATISLWKTSQQRGILTNFGNIFGRKSSITLSICIPSTNLSSLEIFPVFYERSRSSPFFRLHCSLFLKRCCLWSVFKVCCTHLVYVNLSFLVLTYLIWIGVKIYKTSFIQLFPRQKLGS